MNLDATIAALIEREGGYSNNPADKGGPTMYGITEFVARAFGYNGPMNLLPIIVAKQIYRARYWTQPRFDQVNLIDQAIAEELLDTGVNMGTGTASKFLQRALNVLNDGGKRYPDLTVDGNLGNMSMQALKTLLATRATDGRATLLKMLNGLQSVRYIEIAEANTSQEQFEFGWQRNRVADLALPHVPGTTQFQDLP